MTPTVSIIIPIRDQAPRLRLTLAALECQNGVEAREVEVIVVDDGSRDGVWDMLATSAAQVPYRLLRARAQSHGCRGITRNTGATLARGAILIFLDADACPGRGLIAGHLAAQVGGGAIALGDCHMIAGTELLLDPAAGVPFPGVTPEEAASATVIKTDALREYGEAALWPHATKGVYPGLAAWQKTVEEMVVDGSCDFDWVGSIPHNLSLPREVFFRVGGMDPFLRHLEGWDLGIKARRAGCRLKWAPGATSFHLYHLRNDAQNLVNMAAAERLLLKRYPDAAIEAALLWGHSFALGADDVPDEMNLNNWRVVQRLHGAPETREMLSRLYGRRAAATRWASLMDYLGGLALNAPVEGALRRGQRRALARDGDRQE